MGEFRQDSGAVAVPRRYSNSEIKRIIDEYIHNPRDRMILYENIANHASYEELAEMASISRSQVARILKRGRPVVFSLYDKNETK